MSFIINDPALLALLSSGKPVELTDPTGRVLGTFLPDHSGKLPLGVQSPFTDEELARRRALPQTGRTLKEILRDLEQGNP